MSTREQPQRIAAAVPMGSLLKGAGRAMAAAQRSPAPSDLDHLAAIRELPCLKCGMDPCGEAAHVRLQSGAHGKHGGMGKKPDDRWAVSLCPDCHRNDPDSLHRIGEANFWQALGINPLLVCVRLFGASPDIVRMRMVIFQAVAERTV